MPALHPVTARKVDAVLSGIQSARSFGRDTAASKTTGKPIPTKGYPMPKGGPKQQGGPVFQTPATKLGAPSAAGSAGGAAGTGVGTAPTPMTTVAPFLTPAQSAALAAFDAKYNGSVLKTNNGLANAAINTNAALAASQKTHDVNTDSADQNAAARGLFQSSIRDGALNDIDTTLVTRQNILNTALRNSAITAQTNLAALNSSFATEHQLYNQYAALNAAGVVPNPGVGTGDGTTPALTATSKPPASSTSAAKPKPAAAASGFTPIKPQHATVGFDPMLTSGKPQATGAKPTQPRMPKGGGKMQGGPVSRTGTFRVGPPGMAA